MLAQPSHNLRPAPPTQRRGMVLIFVVVILALLAVMVTAYVASVRLDAVPLSDQIGGPTTPGMSDFGLKDFATLDTQLESLRSSVQQKIIDDLSGGGIGPASYRAAGYDSRTGFNSSPSGPNTWLASSVPVETSAGSGLPMWKHISRWMGPVGPFDDPRSAMGASIAYNITTDVEPIAVQVNHTAGPGQNRFRLYPALRTSDGVRIAADADGDGVADAGLFYLTGPTGALVPGDVLYYGAVRVVDNAAMVNINTAWVRDLDITITDGSNTYNNGFFLSNVGLFELLRPTFQGDTSANATDIDNLEKTRMGGYTSMLPTPYNDNATPRADFTFTTWAEVFDSQIGRRTANPGRRDNNSAFVSMQAGNIPALRYRFTLINPDNAPTTAELALSASLYRSAANYADTPLLSDRIFRFYPAAVEPSSGPLNVTRWFEDNFHVDSSTAPNTAPTLRAYTTAYNPVSNAITRHYWAGTSLPAGMPAYSATLATRASVNTDDFKTLWRAYWNVMCDDNSSVAAKPANANMFDSPLRGGTPLSDRQTQLLRAALAAANTETLRNGSTNVISHTVVLPPDGASPNRIATVYGQTRHPFFTEVVIDRMDDGTTAQDYIALELYNPYSVALSLLNCKLAAFDRVAGTLTEIPLATPFAAGDTIPSGGYIVLHTAAALPGDVTIAGGVKTFDVPALAVNQEVVLLRPRSSVGTIRSGTDAEGRAYNENNLTDLVPVDQVALKAPGLAPAALPPITHRRWHYERDTDPWKFIYPGKLTPAGTLVMDFQEDPQGGWTSGSLGAANTNPIPAAPTIQLCNDDMPGPYPKSASGNRFPFGGFARNGDILTVPYFGAYRITDSVGGPIRELTGASFDTAYMDNGITGENVGRFCPTPGDPADPYAWAAKLFDYLTVHSPASDFLPNVSPRDYTDAGVPAAQTPQPVPNGPAITVAAANTDAENLVPSQGLINVNTAPWEVIAMLPMVPNNPAANEAIAKAIVAYRENPSNGPFKNLFELNKVPGFQAPPGMPADPDDSWGDISPVGQGNTDGVSDDFEYQYLILNRISNLATTRSDSFTCYVLVQAWQIQPNPSTNVPRLIGERRSAFIVDRSTITQTKFQTNDLKIIDISTR